MSVSRVAYVELSTPELERSVAHATDILGLREVERVGDRVYLTCNERHHELVLRRDATAGIAAVALEVTAGQAFAELVASVQAAGYRCSDAEVPGVERAVRVSAPGGMTFDLISGMATDQPRRFNSVGRSPRKFGHATLVSDAAEELEQLLCGPLGFRLSDQVPGVLSWFRCSADHHSVAIMPADAGSGSGMHHYAFELEGWSDVEAFADHLAINGTSLIWGPGRHGPGRNIFTYHLDPIGGVVEVFTDLQRIDDDEGYEPRSWPMVPLSLNEWGPAPPPDFFDHVLPTV